MSAHLHVARLYHGRWVSISDVRCRPHCRECGGEECTEDHQMVFVRAGVFVRRRGRQQLVADPNQVLFFNRHEPYRVSHPVGDGDDCTAFAFASKLLREVIEVFAPQVSGQQPFEFAQTLGGQRHFLLHQRLRRLLLAGEEDNLAVEEAALNLLGAVITGVYQARGVRSRSCRAATAEAHREHAEATRLVLASRFAEDLSLDDIARAVHCSPFHLARVFRGQSGLSIHQYRHRLRLRGALQCIEAGASDLSRLALDSGFSSHSHFTDAFHRAFGLSPSACRKLSPRCLREMSRNLKVDQSQAGLGFMRAGRAVASRADLNWKGSKRMKTKKCSVCDWEIKDGGKEVKLPSGAVVTVCCDDCAAKVKTAPEKFIPRK